MAISTILALLFGLVTAFFAAVYCFKPDMIVRQANETARRAPKLLNTSHFLFSRAKAASQSDRFVEPDSVCSCLARGFCSSQSCLSLNITDVADCASNQSMKPTSPTAKQLQTRLPRHPAVAYLILVRRKACVHSHIRLKPKSTPIRSRFCVAGSSRASCAYRLRPAGSGASSPLSGVACLPRLQVRWQTLYPARPEIHGAEIYRTILESITQHLEKLNPKTRALRNMGLWTNEIHATREEAALCPDNSPSVHCCPEKSELNDFLLPF